MTFLSHQATHILHEVFNSPKEPVILPPDPPRLEFQSMMQWEQVEAWNTSNLQHIPTLRMTWTFVELTPQYLETEPLYPFIAGCRDDWPCLCLVPCRANKFGKLKMMHQSQSGLNMHHWCAISPAAFTYVYCLLFMVIVLTAVIQKYISTYT